MGTDKAMLDADLARIYGVKTKVLNQAVKRNIERFPENFMFRLTQEEFGTLRHQARQSGLRSQIVTSKTGAGRGGAALSTLCFHRTWRRDGGDGVEH